MEALGQGTERLESHIEQLFQTHSAHPVIRVDRDTVRSKHAFDQILDQVHQGDPCILVGTQMLAKGHHFPNVTLVVILDADAGLFSADFRGMEKTAQLLEQVAGRAGRGDHPGEVWIQTLYADHPQLNLLIQGGYHALASHELTQRKGLGLPPYAFMTVLRSEAPSAQLAEAFLQHARGFIQQIAHHQQSVAPISLVGPFAPPMERRSGRYRQMLQLLCDERQPLHNVLAQLAPFLETLKGFHKVRWSIDVDAHDLS